MRREMDLVPSDVGCKCGDEFSRSSMSAGERGLNRYEERHMYDSAVCEKKVVRLSRVDRFVVWAIELSSRCSFFDSTSEAMFDMGIPEG